MRFERSEIENPFKEIVEIEITDSFDLHAYRPSEVKVGTEAYLKAAHKKGFKLVRIIHGKGIGVQREIVGKVLSESSLVLSFQVSVGFGSTTAILKH